MDKLVRFRKAECQGAIASSPRARQNKRRRTLPGNCLPFRSEAFQAEGWQSVEARHPAAVDLQSTRPRGRVSPFGRSLFLSVWQGFSGPDNEQRT